MTEQEKQLLLVDLCARFPYDVIVKVHDVEHGNFNAHVENISRTCVETHAIEELDYNPYVFYKLEDIKPYLRPMSSMTEEEKREFQSFFPGGFGSQWFDIEKGTIDIFECTSTVTLYIDDYKRVIDWLNRKMFDYRGLIPMDLALPAPEGMYKTE